MILFFTVLIILLLRFWYMPFIFFIQDEWYVIGTFISEGIGSVWSGLDSSRLGHFVPLGKIFSYTIYSIFGLNSLPYNILAMVVHSLNSFMVLLISGKLISNRLWKIIPPLVFLSSYVGYEQVNWPMVGLNSLSIGLSLLAWYLSFDLKKASIWRICLIPFLLVSSILIIESSLPMLIFIPAFILITNKGKLNTLIKYVTPVLAVFVIYLGFRNVNIKITYQLITRPIEYLAQSFIPQPFILKISNIIANDSPMAESGVFPVIALVLGLTLLFAILILLRKKQIFLLILSFVLIFSLPFLFVPGTARNFSIFPSRYLYPGSIGSSLIIGLLGLYLYERKSKFEKLYFSLIILMVGFNLYLNFSTNKRFYLEGLQRLRILNEIKALYPYLPRKVIFYTISDQPYYGLPAEDHILPFQSGFGQTLLIWYSQTEKFPKNFYRERFLWEIKDQGYKEADGRGFGYFRDLELLKKAIKENKIPKESLYAFSWDGAVGEIKNISDRIRNELF